MSLIFIPIAKIVLFRVMALIPDVGTKRDPTSDQLESPSTRVSVVSVTALPSNKPPVTSRT